MLKIRYILLFFLFILVLGTLGFSIIEKWNFFDSLYMTVITIFTVGYREVQPLSITGRIFTIIIIFTGAGTVFYLGAAVVEGFIENRLIRGKKMERKIQKLQDHYIICGYGRMGNVICKDLSAQSVPFIIMENDSKKIAAIEDEGYLFFEGDVTDDKCLLKVGIEKAKGLVTVLSADSDNVFVTLTARSLNPSIFIVARSNTEGSVHKLLQAGANKVINPFLAAGKHMSQLLLKPVVVDFIEVVARDTSLDLRMEEVKIAKGSSLVGVKLKDTIVRSQLNIIIVAIKKKDGTMVFNPSSETEISTEDILIALGGKENLQKLDEIGRSV